MFLAIRFENWQNPVDNLTSDQNVFNPAQTPSAAEVSLGRSPQVIFVLLTVAHHFSLNLTQA